ncbi:MAG: oxidoreductase [Paenibacillus sp.]|jgi:predicted dehydrogenase|nr:oxidoreductase [Paenibacillus sp.]
MNGIDGMNYEPIQKPSPVVGPGEFDFAAMGLDHGHINSMSRGLIEAGARLKWVYDPDPVKVKAFCDKHPGVQAASSEDQIFQDNSVRLIAGAKIPSDRCALGLRAMDHGKHYFTDKTPFTTLAQLELAREKTRQTGLIWAVNFSERLHVESAVYAGELIKAGAIGRVVQVIGAGPHRCSPEKRPDWFFRKANYGGILCDIGSHQIEQFLYYSGAKDAKVLHSKVANYAHKQYPELEDFGDATLVADNGATNYFRVDWLTPNGSAVWGDGRTLILGTDGYIELRKYIDIGRDREGDHLYIVNHEGERHLSLKGKVGFPYFGQFILDCLNGTELAMPQSHTFKAAELCLAAQEQAVKVE